MRVFLASLIVVVVSSTAWANAPAPWAVCGGKKAGDSCSSIYYPFGRCVARDSGCESGQSSCLMCESRSGCELGAEGAAAAAVVLGAFGLLALWRRRLRRRGHAPP